MISIITIVKNDDAHIEKSLRSVVNQKTKEIEYIVIDGQSSDNTLDIIKKYKADIDVLISEPDTGIYDALNKGIRKAKGEWITICHSGDWVEENWLEKVKNALRDSSAEIIAGKLRYWSNNESSVVLNLKPLNHLVRYCSVYHTATIVKKELYTKVGLYPEDYRISGDYYWFLRSYLQGVKFDFVDEVLSNFKGGGLSDMNLLAAYTENTKAQLSLYERGISKVGACFFYLYRICCLPLRILRNVIGL